MEEQEWRARDHYYLVANEAALARQWFEAKSTDVEKRRKTLRFAA